MAHGMSSNFLLGKTWPLSGGQEESGKKEDGPLGRQGGVGAACPSCPFPATVVVNRATAVASEGTFLCVPCAGPWVR